MNLQNKLTLSMAIALTTLLVIALGISTFMMRSLIEERVTKQELPATLGEIRGEVGQLIATPMLISQELANNQYLIDALKNGESQTDQNEIVLATLTVFTSREMPWQHLQSAPKVTTITPQKVYLKPFQLTKKETSGFSTL